MTTINEIIEKIINTSVKPLTKEQAKEFLRNCGILDENYNISENYKDIVVKKV